MMNSSSGIASDCVAADNWWCFCLLCWLSRIELPFILLLKRFNTLSIERFETLALLLLLLLLLLLAATPVTVLFTLLLAPPMSSISEFNLILWLLLMFAVSLFLMGKSVVLTDAVGVGDTAFNIDPPLLLWLLQLIWFMLSAVLQLALKLWLLGWSFRFAAEFRSFDFWLLFVLTLLLALLLPQLLVW